MRCARQPYGELDKGNHADLKKVDAKKATYTKEGNITYWYCAGCGKYYSDAEATKEITKADTVIPRKTHSSNPGSTGTGSGSGSTTSGSTGSGADVKKGVQSSKTGRRGRRPVRGHEPTVPDGRRGGTGPQAEGRLIRSALSPTE